MFVAFEYACTPSAVVPPKNFIVLALSPTSLLNSANSATEYPKVCAMSITPVIPLVAFTPAALKSL